MSRKRQLALSAFFSSSKKMENEEGTGSGSAGSGEQLQQPHDGTGSGSAGPSEQPQQPDEEHVLPSNAWDIANFCHISVPNDIKYRLTVDRKPRSHIQMPSKVYKDSRRKSGTSNLFVAMNGLTDLILLHEEGLFCLPCVLFPSLPGEGGTCAKRLITEAFNDWKNAIDDLKPKLQYSHAKMHAFLNSFKNPASQVDMLLNEQSHGLVQKNRFYLKLMYWS